jgi:hypothetical protein
MLMINDRDRRGDRVMVVHHGRRAELLNHCRVMMDNRRVAAAGAGAGTAAVAAEGVPAAGALAAALIEMAPMSEGRGIATGSQHGR